jgi:hypothetical protein
VGELEQTPPTAPLPPGVTKEMAAKGTHETSMVDNARDLAARLSALKGGPSYEMSFRVFDGQTHVSVFWASVNTLPDFCPSASHATCSLNR